MIEINNLTSIPADKTLLKRIARTVLEKENKNDFSLSIALINPNKIKRLNKQYLKRDKVTDVLSFSSANNNLSKNFFPDKNTLGEIVICPQQVKKNAKEFNCSFNREIGRVLIHGILHLLGYDHEKSAEKGKIMETKENYYLQYFLNNG